MMALCVFCITCSLNFIDLWKVTPRSFAVSLTGIDVPPMLKSCGMCPVPNFTTCDLVGLKTRPRAELQSAIRSKSLCNFSISSMLSA